MTLLWHTVIEPILKKRQKQDDNKFIIYYNHDEYAFKIFNLKEQIIL